ncbi:hypothetical protein R5A26_31680, partial [Streptomyces prunicolor]|nr:hypothetical protein [Streptomyces prunicolor]
PHRRVAGHPGSANYASQPNKHVGRRTIGRRLEQPARNCGTTFKPSTGQKESTSQDNLYWLYYNLYHHEPDDLPALLPEVWLHWDHQTIKQRREGAQQHIRMDFLLLMPGRRRVVLEVDGRQHYTDNQGKTPSPSKYAATMSGDRELKLLGYQVYRFGHDELKDIERARPLLDDFFSRLLKPV